MGIVQKIWQSPRLGKWHAGCIMTGSSGQHSPDINICLLQIVGMLGRTNSIRENFPGRLGRRQQFRVPLAGMQPTRRSLVSSSLTFVQGLPALLPIIHRGCEGPVFHISKNAVPSGTAFFLFRRFRSPVTVFSVSKLISTGLFALHRTRLTGAEICC